MKIHPLWTLCIFVRIFLIIAIRYVYMNMKESFVYKLLVVILITIGSGFLYKAYFGSNNEEQIAKVFWHEARYVHGILYLLSVYYLMINNINMNSIILITDLLFSFTYRIVKNK